MSQIQQKIESRYELKKLFGHGVTADNALEFVGTDTTTQTPCLIRLYFKGDPINCEFYEHSKDPNYRVARDECNKHNLLASRVYGKDIAQTSMEQKDLDKTQKSTKPQEFKDVRVPKCLTNKAAENSYSYYYNAYTLPEGENLAEKCLLEENMNQTNSCIPFVSYILQALVRMISVCNKGTTFLKHGNITPDNLWLKMSTGKPELFIGLMKVDHNIYDNIKMKPFDQDFDMTTKTIMKILTGTRKNVFEGQPPFQGPFDMMQRIRKYYEDNSISIRLDSAVLGVDGVDTTGGKLITRAEAEFKMQKSAFSLISKMQCSGVLENNQFTDPAQALGHDFANPNSSGSDNGIDEKNRDPGAMEQGPSDY